MARATLDDQLKRNRSRIQASRKWREEEKYDETWRRLKDLYGLKHFRVSSRHDQIAVAISFSTINVIHPAISVNRPKTTVAARRPEDNDKAIISEAVLDWLWTSYDIGDEFRRAVKDFLVLGHGWTKTGYRFVEQEVPRDPADIEADYQSALEQADQHAMANPEVADSVPTDEEIRANIPTTTTMVCEDRPFVERVSPHDMFVDTEATAMANCGWIAQRIRRPIEEVRSDPSYDARARSKAKPDVQARWTASDVDGKRNRAAPEDQRVTVWEFYDLKAQTICVFAESGEGFLVKPTKIPYHIGQPFHMLRNYDVPDEFYPLGDLEAIEPLQHELNAVRTQQQTARRQLARKILARGSAFGSEARRALESDEDEFVFINESQDPLGDLVAPLPTNTIPPELFNFSQQISGDIAEVSGVSDYQRGAASEIRRTATEASMIQDAVNARSAEKLALIEKAIARIGKSMMGLCRQYMTGEQVARVVGPQGLPLWVPYTQEDIDCDADFEVEGGSTMPKNEAFRQNQAMQLLQALGPLIGQVIDPAEVAKYVLQSFGVKTPEQFLMKQPPQLPPGAPQGPPGAPPGADPTQVATPPTPDPQTDPNAQPEPGVGAVPPEILAQLQGQVGLNIGA